MSSNRHRWLSPIVLALIAVMLVCSAWDAAAQTTATIRGRVTNEAGEGIPAADIVATNVNSGFTSLAVTQDNGSFTLAGLQPGTVRPVDGDGVDVHGGRGGHLRAGVPEESFESRQRRPVPGLPTVGGEPAQVVESDLRASAAG